MPDSPARRPVIMLTDFGLVDDFPGVCHAVIEQRAPGTPVVHLTHGIDPQNVAQGALVLRNTLRFTPIGVHLSIVDPGVGTARRELAVDCADGRSFVGPDNGLLEPAIELAGGITRAVSLESRDFRLEPVSATFHGRDVFAPAAAHLAAGGDIGDLGPDVEAHTLATIGLPTSRVERGTLIGQVWHFDRFGNTALAVDEEMLREFAQGDDQLEIQVRNDRYYADITSTFGGVREGGLLLYVDAYGSVALGVNHGDAKAMFRLRVGDSVRIRRIVVDASRSPVASGTTSV